MQSKEMTAQEQELVHINNLISQVKKNDLDILRASRIQHDGTKLLQQAYATLGLNILDKEFLKKLVTFDFKKIDKSVYQALKLHMTAELEADNMRKVSLVHSDLTKIIIEINNYLGMKYSNFYEFEKQKLNSTLTNGTASPIRKISPVRKNQKSTEKKVTLSPNTRASIELRKDRLSPMRGQQNDPLSQEYEGLNTNLQGLVDRLVELKVREEMALFKQEIRSEILFLTDPANKGKNMAAAAKVLPYGHGYPGYADPNGYPIGAGYAPYHPAAYGYGYPGQNVPIVAAP